MILDLTHSCIGLGKDNCKTGRETFKFWNLEFGAPYIRDFTVNWFSVYSDHIPNASYFQCTLAELVILHLIRSAAPSSVRYRLQWVHKVYYIHQCNIWYSKNYFKLLTRILFGWIIDLVSDMTWGIRDQTSWRLPCPNKLYLCQL